MGRVYAHSMLEATVGTSCLLKTRNPRLIAPCTVRSHWTGLKSIRYVITDFRYWDSRIYRSVCNTRAWITQERWLAPRVLHFTFDQLIWECCELEAGETYPQGLTKEMKSQSSIGFKTLNSEFGADNGTLTEFEARLEDWRDVLLTYSRVELTYRTYRLVAIAGIASRFSKILDDEWLAGLWRKTLPGELLWYVNKTRRANKPPPTMEIVAERGLGVNHMHQVHLSERLKGAQYQAPRWSWASVLGDIIPSFFMPDGSEDSMIEVLDVELVLFDHKMQLGRLVGGTLSLKGALYPMAMDPPDWTPEAAKKDYKMWRPTIYLTGLEMKEVDDPMGLGLGEQTRALTLKAGLPVPKIRSHVVHLQADEPTLHADLARSCFLPVRKHTINSPASQYHGKTLVSGLALMPTGKRGEYTRLGRVDFGNEAVSLFGDELKTQKGSRAPPGLQAHLPTQDAALYIQDQIGVFTIV